MVAVAHAASHFAEKKEHEAKGIKRIYFFFFKNLVNSQKKKFPKKNLQFLLV
jgi:hypothetical protein